jgi:methylated-DNA-[protein]-cysteine S-methyltransferase
MNSAGGYAVMAAPFGAVLLRAEGGMLAGIDLLPEPRPPVKPQMPELQEAQRQLQCYFDDPAWPFSLPLPVQGTLFQQRVWNALRAIPKGQVRRYGDLSRELGSAPRAVAGACKANGFPLIVPCHRVVSGAGLGGYCGRSEGPYLEIKRWLLRHEGYDGA